MRRVMNIGFLRDKSTIILTISIILVVFTTTAVDSTSNDDAQKYVGHKPILGNFATFSLDDPIQKIFEEYFHKVLKPNDEALLRIDKENDSRVYRPTPELCINKLVGFKNNGYVLKNPIDLIPIDACLEWLFNKEPHRAVFDTQEVEQLAAAQKKEVKSLKHDSKLKTIFESTNFKKNTDFPPELKNKIYGFLSKILDINADNPRSSCHGLWMSAYNDFVDDIYLTDCEDQEDCPYFGYEHDGEDSYLQMLLESIKNAARDCYSVTHSQMRRLMSEEYENFKPVQSSIVSRLGKQTPAEQQMEDEKWSKQMVQILQITSDVSEKEAVNLGDVVYTLDLIKNRRYETIERFTNALSEYAVNNVNMKDTANDAQGTNRYRKAMFKLCRPYIDPEVFLSLVGVDPTEKKPFDFYGLVYSLVRLTNHMDIFGITKSTFEQDIVLNKWESLYLATFACQIISSTHAEIDYRIPNHERFDVTFRDNFQDLINDWPIEQLMVSLPVIYPKGGKHKLGNSNGANGGSNSKGSAKFGLKFGQFFHKSGKNEPTAVPEATESSSTKGVEKKKPTITLEWINYWKDLNGKYPRSLPDNIRKIYPELPADMTKTYTKLSREEMDEKWPKGPPPRLDSDVIPEPVTEAPKVVDIKPEPAKAPIVEAPPQQNAAASVMPQMMLQPGYQAPMMVPQTPMHPSMLVTGAPLHPAAMPPMMQQSYVMPVAPVTQEPKSDAKSDKKSHKWFKRSGKKDDKSNEDTSAAVPAPGAVVNGMINPMVPNPAGLPNYPIPAYNAPVMGMNGGPPSAMGDSYGNGAGPEGNYGPSQAPGAWGRPRPPASSYDSYGSGPDYNRRPPADDYDRRYDNNNWRGPDDGYSGNSGGRHHDWDAAPRRGGYGGPPDQDWRRQDMDRDRGYGGRYDHGDRYGGNDRDRSDRGNHWDRPDRGYDTRGGDGYNSQRPNDNRWDDDRNYGGRRYEGPRNGPRQGGPRW